MQITKTKSKTVLTIVAKTDELRSTLENYQKDILMEMVESLYGNQPSLQATTKFGMICLKNGKEFQDLIERTETQWVTTPDSFQGWAEAVINTPYLFGVTDDVVTEDVDEVILWLDGNKFIANGLIKNI